MEIQYIPQVAGEVQSRQCNVLQVKCPSLLTDRNQNYTLVGLRLWSDRGVVSEKSLSFQAR